MHVVWLGVELFAPGLVSSSPSHTNACFLWPSCYKHIHKALKKLGSWQHVAFSGQLAQFTVKWRISGLHVCPGKNFADSAGTWKSTTNPDGLWLVPRSARHCDIPQDRSTALATFPFHFLHKKRLEGCLQTLVHFVAFHPLSQGI